MARKFSLAFVAVLTLLVESVILNGQEAGNLERSKASISEQEYYFAFTEATKFYLLGNYVQAVNLYRECLKIKPKSGAVHYELAKIFMSSGNATLAREHAKLACISAGDNKWYLEELADIYQAEQKFDSAIYIYNKLVSIDNSNMSYKYSIATLYERLDMGDEALSYLNAIEKEVGPSNAVSVSKYRILDSKGLDKLALAQLKRAVILSENDYTTTGMVAEYFRDHNRFDSASIYYKRIYPAYKDDPIVVFSFGEFLLKFEKIDSAKDVLLVAMKNFNIDNNQKTGFFFKILQNESLFKLTKPVLDTVVNTFYTLNYNDIRSIAIFADIEFRLANYKRSANALKRIVVKDNSNYPAIEQLIFCENVLGDTDSVLFYSKEAMDQFSDKPVPFLFNGSAKFQKKNYKEAATVLEKGLAISDNTALKIEFYSLLAECYENMHEFDKSVFAFDKALDIDTENISVKNNYAYYLSLRAVNLSLAKKMSKSTITKEPDNPTYLDTYAWILYKMNKFHKAKKFIIRAIVSGGERNEEIMKHYGEILISLRKYNEGIEVLKRAVLLNNDTKNQELLDRIKELEGKTNR